MSRKEDLERLILDSYQIIRENDTQIQFADPKKKLELQRENDEHWAYIENYLPEYSNLCQRLGLSAPEDVIQIAAARFPDLIPRLRAARPAKRRPAPAPYVTPPPVAPTPHFPPPPRTLSEDITDARLPFRSNYHLVRPFVPFDEDCLVQFVIAFSNRGDVDFGPIDVMTHVCLVLDVSGSMDTPDKYPYLLQAIPYLIDELSSNDWLSIILFSSRSELVWSKDVASCRGREQDIIQRIDQSGTRFARTHLAPGLRIAIEEIEHLHRIHPGAVSRLYILTDGQLHDPGECYLLNPELRRLEVEVNSYGFGQDFAEETMRRVMEGCPGGRVKWVGHTDELWQSFRHIGEVARRIVATDAELRIDFSANVTSGDAFRFEPGTHWFGTVDGVSKQFVTNIGGLEKERVYMHAFEARLYPSTNERELVATATLRYTFQGERQIVTQDIFVERTHEKRRQGQVNGDIEYLFLVLEGLRTDDPATIMASFQARLDILVDEGGDPDQIELLRKAIQKLATEGTLEGLSEFEQRRLQADPKTELIIAR